MRCPGCRSPDASSRFDSCIRGPAIPRLGGHDAVIDQGRDFLAVATRRLLLDTHTLLWWWKDDRRLSRRAAAAIADEANTVLVGAASAWGIAIKPRIGRLPGAESAVAEFNELISADGFDHLAVTWQHALTAGAFSSDHRDPFDRMQAAQAIIERTQLVTDDAAMQQFRVKCLW